MADKNWVYRVTVPDEKSDRFVLAMLHIGLFEDEYLEVLEEPE